MTPTFSFLIPTHREDRPLARALASIEPQLGPGDEVIVIGDTHDLPLPGVEQLVSARGHTYVAHDAGHHCWGHCQLNYGLTLATGDYIHCQDDDDVWVPGAVDEMRMWAARYPYRPLLFKFKSYHGPIFWQVKVIARNYIGGHCAVVPRARAGRFSCEYSGDFEWVQSSVMRCGGAEQAVWVDKVICVARPPSGVLVTV